MTVAATSAGTKRRRVSIAFGRDITTGSGLEKQLNQCRRRVSGPSLSVAFNPAQLKLFRSILFISECLIREKGGQWTGSSCRPEFFRQANFVCFASGLDRLLERL